MQTQGQEFEVYIRSNSSTPEEWQRAMEAPASELPALDEEQREIAKRFGLTEEEYARSELARLYGQEGLRAKAARFGNIVQRVLSGLDPKNRLTALFYEGVKLRWIVRFETPTGIRSVSIGYELADDLVDYELVSALRQLKQELDEASSEQLGRA